MAALEHRDELEGIVSALDAGATAFTICEIGEGVSLTSSVFEGVAAYHVISGEMHLSLPCGTVHVARPDTLVLVPAGLEPRISPGGAITQPPIDGKDCIGRRGPWTIADASRGRDVRVVVAAARIVGASSDSVRRPSIVSLRRDPAGRKLCALLREEVANPGSASGALAVAMMTACIIVALRLAMAASTERGSTLGGAGAPIARAVTAVRADPGAAHTIDSLAKLSGMSRSTFVRQFSRTMRTSPMQFLQRARLVEAATMLRSGLLPVKAVAAQAGFASRSHFSRAFRKAFGHDPSSFRDLAEGDAPRVETIFVGDERPG